MSPLAENRPVATAPHVRARLWRQRAVPLIVWVACVAALLFVARQRAHFVEGVGLAEGQTSMIAPAVAGTIENVAVDLFAEIQPGQIVAVLNDAIVRAELDTAGAELNRLSAVLTAERRKLEVNNADRQFAAMDDVRRFRMNEEDARVKYLDMTVQQETNAVDLERLRIEMERAQSLVDQNIGEARQYDETRLRYEALKKEMAENTKALGAAKQQLDQAIKRRAERESRPLDPASEDYLLPVRAQVDVQQARIQEIREKRAQLVLRSPIAGKVAQLLRGPGETVLAGDPVLVVADTSSHRVVAYLKEDAAQRVQPGAEVLLRSQGRPQVTARAHVARMGAAIADLPRTAQAMPLFAQRGYPVLIDSIDPGTFIPGERVSVRIRAGAVFR